MTTSLTSALSGIPVRHDIAMTGEITLTGRVLAIGGLREKSTAAYVKGIRTLLIPRDNMRDIPELDPAVQKEVRFIPCSTLSDVLSHALRKPAPAETLPIIEAPEEHEPKTAAVKIPKSDPTPRYNRV